MNQENAPSLICKDLFFTYQMGKERIIALNNVNLSFTPGKFTCLKGPSGSGKSTLLNLLGLIEPLQKGEIHLGGRPYHNIPEEEKNRIRKFQLGLIFQNFHLFNILNARENVEYFLIKQNLPLGERKIRVEEALSKVGLWEHRFKRPLQMSGGQRQRVAIARALAKGPQVMLADEPTASLDQKTGHEIVEILMALALEKKITLIVASHDPMVFSYSHHLVTLKDGVVAENEHGA